MVTTDALVFALVGKKVQVLMVKRGKPPFEGMWAVPGGFVEMDEELEESALRELKEETGLQGVKLEQMHTFGTIGRDPRGRQITVVYIGIAGEGATHVAGGDDAADARWFDIEELPEDIAFDHREVIEMGIAELKKKQACHERVRRAEE